MRFRYRFRAVALGLALTLGLVACGGEEDGGNEAADATDGTDGADGDAEEGSDELSLDQVRLAIDNDDFMNQLAWMVADENYWPDLGFTEPAEVVTTDEYIAGLVGGDVWVAQGESDVIWAATAEGSVPLKIVGVEKDSEAWFLGIREGVDADNLEGLKISGGDAADRNVTIGRHILEDMGFDPDSMEWISISGGSDDRLPALISGQIDVAVLQPRHRLPLEEAGGQMIYEEYKDVPQEVWVTTADVLENHQDALCAYIEGRVAAKQWLSEGGEPDFDANKEAGVALGRARGLDPSEGDLEEWADEMRHNWALDGGSPYPAFLQWTEDMVADGTVPSGYDFREHADFTCLWQAQESLGLPLNPDPADIDG